MSDDCTLCGLPTASQPVTAQDVAGRFCCRGCLEVARAIDDADDVSPSDVQERTPSEVVDAEDEVPDEASTVYLEIDGMHCTTCEAFVALRGESRDGIHAVEANYATETARVHYDPARVDETDVPSLLSGYGYTAQLGDSATEDRPTEDEATEQRLLVGEVLAMLIMPWYVFFLYPRYGGFRPGALTTDMTTPLGLYFPMVTIGVLSGVVVFYTGWPILRGAYVSVRTGQPNMSLLLAVAILAAFAYSTVALVTGSIHIYYDVAVVIVLAVTVGGYYEDRVKRQATGLLSDLTTRRVTDATRRCTDGTTDVVAVDDLGPGDEVVVRPGERVPVDGTVVDGVAAVDEAIVTGESLPTTKRPGDTAIGGSVVTDNTLVVAVDDAAESTLDRITALLWSVQTDRPGVQRFADKLATVFVPLVLVVGGAVAAWRLFDGDPIAAAVLAGLTVLVAACPCAMGLATPLAVAGGLRDALERGIVVTNTSLFETAPAVDTVVFDKTGTLTTGEPTVRSVVGETESLRAAAAVERYSSHPVASAVVDYVSGDADGGQELLPPAEDGAAEAAHVGPDPSLSVTDFERHPGGGVSARVDGDPVVVGTPALVSRRVGPLSEELQTAVSEARDSGDLPVVVGRGDRATAVLVVGDRARDDWHQALDAFGDREVVVLTGDDETAARPFRDHDAVDRVFAGVPPDGKVATLRSLRAAGTTAMVGDGTNDAPALGVADVGITIAGTARAADAADVVLVDGSLTDVPAVFNLASATRRRIRENVGWALCYNALAIPLAAAGVLNPLLAAVAMAASSLLVVTNSRRPLL